MRLPTWQLSFEQFCAERRRMPFQWGRNDCALFAADCVLALTGRDFALPWRGYSSEVEAAELLRAHGGLEGFGRLALGEPCEMHKVIAGDVVLICQEDLQISLGIFTGAACIGPGIRGTMVVTREHAILAWNI